MGGHGTAWPPDKIPPNLPENRDSSADVANAGPEPDRSWTDKRGRADDVSVLTLSGWLGDDVARDDAKAMCRDLCVSLAERTALGDRAGAVHVGSVRLHSR